MSINSRDIDSYIEHRRSSYSGREVPVRQKVSKPAKKDIFEDDPTDVPERKPFSFFGLFGKKDDYEEPEDDYDEMVSASKGKEMDFSGKDDVGVKFDSHGNIIGSRPSTSSSVPQKQQARPAAKSANPSQASQSHAAKKKGGIFGFFAGSDDSDDDDADHADHAPAKSGAMANDMIVALDSMDKILARLSPKGLETIRASNDYAVLESMRKKYHSVQRR